MQAVALFDRSFGGGFEDDFVFVVGFVALVYQS
jgi:hypothetical protein